MLDTKIECITFSALMRIDALHDFGTSLPG